MAEVGYRHDDNGLSTTVWDKLFFLLWNISFQRCRNQRSLYHFNNTFQCQLPVHNIGNVLRREMGPQDLSAVWFNKFIILYDDLATVGTFGRETDFSNIVLIIVTCCFIFWFAITLGPVTFVLVSELFPLRTRAISMAICTFINWMFNFLISFLTPMIVSKIDFKLGYIFATCLLALIVFSWILVPETRNKNEQEVNKIFESE